ncbi:hypothetical protein [Erythrobacter ani]|uniref:Uncharacterized protein n=1 Tax=Erythrobacter ani TaxID=2827235 RepID=A0ABS6SNK8_9SPHN|nr:hypothetical protein [Erythrobacter ani]MBV7266611.1 hypothetical protein [Erythrobacter ani]
MDGGVIGLGITLIGMGLGVIIAPHAMVRESERNHARRLKELKEGAPEAYLEEKRELEAYRPRFDLSDKTIRKLGGVAAILGGAAVFEGIF